MCAVIAAQATKSWSGPAEAWAPYEPTADNPWNRAKVLRLHRLAGFGCSQKQLERDAADEPAAVIGRLLSGEDRARDGRPRAEYDAMVSAMEASCRQQTASIARAQTMWLYRMLLDPWPLREKMTLAWHTHYATSYDKVERPDYLMVQNAAQRELWGGPVRQLHLKMLRDPAMLVWLDAVASTPDRPNENLSREFLELFALGINHYSEEDVREGARALTGWQQKYINVETVLYEPSAHDAGEKKYLGQTGPWKDEDIVRIACEQPAAAERIAWRLWKTFLSDTDEPDKELLTALAETMRTPGDVDVRRGVETVLRSRYFHSAEAARRRVLSPVEFVAGALAALEIAPPDVDVAELNRQITRMGQQLYLPPNVAGWPGGLEWLTGPAAIARTNFAAWLTSDASQLGGERFAKLAKKHQWSTPEAQLDGWSGLLLGAPLPNSTKQSLLGEASALKGSAATSRIIVGLLSAPEAQIA
jgi:uncharacterized protein (DUF1800 family)